MGTITAGIGLMSGIDTASLIEALITLESKGKFALQNRVITLQSQQAAMIDINARLLNLRNIAKSFKSQSIFQSALALSSNESIFTATATTKAQPGTFSFIVKQLAANSQKLSKGFNDANVTPLGLESLSFNFGKGNLDRDRQLAELNGGNGVAAGKISITDKAGSTATIDLADATTLGEVLDRINSSAQVSVNARIDGDRLLVEDTSGGGGTLTIAGVAGATTAADLGIAGSSAPGSGTITGTKINTLGAATSLTSLNDGLGVLIQNNVPDLQIIARDGSTHNIDLGQVNSPITGDTLLADLNNGLGITLSSDNDNPDIKFVARDGTEYEVNLTGVTTVGQLISRVNQGTFNDGAGQAHIQIGIHADGKRLTVTDTIGGADPLGPLKVLGAGTNGTKTASDLGILNVDGAEADVFTGSIIPNTISIPAATTLGQVIERITAQTNGKVTASIAADGVSIKLTDTTGGTENLRVNATAGNQHAAGQLGIKTSAAGVASSELGGTRLIAHLGSVLVQNLNGGSGLPNSADTVALAPTTLLANLFGGAGLSTNNDQNLPDIFIQDRTGATHLVEVDGLTTVQDLIDAFAAATGGAVTLAIEGQALVATNHSLGASNFQIADLNGASVASQLGITIDSAVAGPNEVTGVDTQPIGASTFTITNRLGQQATIDVDGLHSLDQIIAAINGAGIDVTASLNSSGTGLLITDESGGSGNLIIDGGVAGDLGIATGEAGVAANTVGGSNLHHKYIGVATKLSDLNYGKGIGHGSFKITDGFGTSATFNINANQKTLADVIQVINAQAGGANGLAIKARLNDTGTGLLIEADLTDKEPGASPFVPIKVESVSGSTAKDLGILGQSKTTTNAVIDGSYTKTVELSPSDSLNKVVEKINAAGIPLSASVLNTGSGANPFRLNFTSSIGGALGELIIDSGGVDLGLATLSKGQDAKVFFGSPESGGFLITSQTNQVKNVLEGVTLDLHAVSDQPVSVTVSRDTAKIKAAVGQFVAAFNEAIKKIGEYDFFDVEKEQRGVLLGNPTSSRVRTALYRAIRQQAEGVDTQYQFLSDIGIRIGSGGIVEFDEAKFTAAYESDPTAVEKLFTAFESVTQGSEEIAPGITIPSSSTITTVRGLGAIFDDLLKGLTDPIDGTLTLADNGFKSQIDIVQDRIKVFEQRLEAKKQRLERQFMAMETALSRLQNQGNALSSLAGNIQLAGHMFK